LGSWSTEASSKISKVSGGLGKGVIGGVSFLPVSGSVSSLDSDLLTEMPIALSSPVSSGTT